ncbi:MAG: anaerobic ribonucleoside-triphosphate reductase, partial [Anaerolineales bacterium]
MSVRQVIKRDGSIVDFDRKRIENAVYAAARAVGNGEGRPWAEMISWAVTGILKDQFGGRETPPHVEQIQDIVEQVLVKSGNPQVAKAYILYRQQRANARATEQMLLDTEKLVEDYLQRADWRVNENSNMNYSLQGLNFYLASSIAARYWLHTIYPPEVQEAHIEGDLHIHDLGMLSVYCCGWDLQDLLQEGFGGVPAKIESKPPRHLRTALGQLVNFFYTLQGESAGAVAVSNFDTLLAPFIRYDGLNYAQVKQAVQEFVFNINVPTRVGFQCLSEDTDILTPQGWKSYDDLQVGDTIKTFNLETGVIEDQPVLQLFARPYSGPMYRLRNRIQDQLISPGHRVVRKKFNAESMFVLEEIEQVATYKSPVIIPVSGLNENPPGDISDEEIRLVAWIIAEGTKESSNQHRHSNRITIYQSQEKSPDEYAEIIRLLEHLDLTYSVRDSTPALGQPVRMIRLNAESSHHLLDTLFGSRESVKFIPDRLKNLDQHQARLFLDTYLKADGHEGCEITTSDIEILNGLQHIAVDAGYGFTVSTRKPTLGRKPLHILRLIAHQDTYIQRIETVEFSGVIWCPTTENQTVIARRRGKVFITGNTPFTNVTMDLAPHPMLRDQPVIIGGETREETYGEFQAEMDLINRAFAEVMLEGDAKGRVFTFPIPTYNIGKDFDWENPDLEPIWRMAAKYGIPYFANFVNSDMQPEDAR